MFFEYFQMIIKMSEGGGSEIVLRRNLPGTKSAEYSRYLNISRVQGTILTTYIE